MVNPRKRSWRGWNFSLWTIWHSVLAPTLVEVDHVEVAIHKIEESGILWWEIISALETWMDPENSTKASFRHSISLKNVLLRTDFTSNFCLCIQDSTPSLENFRICYRHKYWKPSNTIYLSLDCSHTRRNLREGNFQNVPSSHKGLKRAMTI